MTLLIYLPENTARSEYIFDFIFREIFGISFLITSQKDEFLKFNGPKIGYCSERISSSFYVHNHGLLSDLSSRSWSIPVQNEGNEIILFPNESDDSGFDIFSASFYLLSRYEEHLPFEGDEFGRFRAVESIAGKNNFLLYPIVDIWIQKLGNLLKEKYPSLSLKLNTFKSILTYDVDVAYKYAGRSVWRNLGSILKDVLKGDTKNLKSRFQTYFKIKKDPWDVYDYLSQLIKSSGIPSVFFFLLGDKGPQDRSLNSDNMLMKKLIRKISNRSEIGIHPSFASNSNTKMVETEKRRLEKISGNDITKSRQHYLKLQFPKTYQQLLKEGIKEDYTMGYPEAPGFRAGTCFPFYYYDIKNEKVTDLKIFPVTVMEATFIYYLKTNPEESLQKIINLIDEVDKVNGMFIPIWHPDNLWESGIKKDWRWCHEKMIGYLSQKKSLNNE